MSTDLSDANTSKKLFLTNLAWNVEGLSRNVYNLLRKVQDEDPSLICLSEPWLHLPDAEIPLEISFPSTSISLTLKTDMTSSSPLSDVEHMEEHLSSGRKNLILM